jgi:glycosyltransferase involved in cell wall biosynthesis
MKIAWLAPYPVSILGDKLEWGLRRQSAHPCSWIMNLSRELARLPDVELHIGTLCPWVKRSQVVTHDRVIVHVVKSGIPFLHRYWPPYCPLDVITDFAVDSFQLCREVARIKPDIIHAHGTENPYALTASRMSYPFVVSMQGIINEIYKVNKTFRFRRVARLEKKAMLATRYVSCRTAFDTGFVRSINPKAHVFQIHEAMNPVFFKRQWDGCERKRILFVGSMGKHKGLDYLLEAVVILSRTYPSIELCILGGSASEIAMYQSHCRELNIEQNVRFEGFLTAEQIAPHHLSSRVFVIPSTNENSPNTLAEAMVSGMPCIASAVGGIPSMIDVEETGLLFSSGNVDQLVGQLERVLEDDALCLRLGNAAAKVARARHYPESVARETHEAYEFILSRAM